MINTKGIKNFTDIKLIDFIPALSGLIGKVALITSFASVWAQELSITSPNFVFENVRIEIIIGSIIALIAAFIYPNVSPAGTLAPLIVLIPTMARFGVHPLILSLLVGMIGMICVKTNLFNTLILLSNNISKASLAFAFGVSGVLLSAEKLMLFFGDHLSPLIALCLLLAFAYLLLLRSRKIWLIIPIAAVISLLIPLLFGLNIDFSSSNSLPNFSPFHWWNSMWGIGFGMNMLTIFKTLPFALFVILLWAIDTISINAIVDANFDGAKNQEEINLKDSFIVVSIRNMIGGMIGGAQTSSLWRSFLIPLFMMKRPIRSSTIILGIIGIIAGFTPPLLKILSFPPLIWSILLFGIFVPFIDAGMKQLKRSAFNHRVVIVLFALVGVLWSPIIPWLGAVLYDKICQKIKSIRH